MKTREEAIAEIAMRVPHLSAARTGELLATAEQDARDGGGRLALILRSYVDDGVMPDRTGWQVFSDVLSEVPELVGLVSPIVGLALSLRPLL